MGVTQVSNFSPKFYVLSTKLEKVMENILVNMFYGFLQFFYRKTLFTN